MKQMVEVGYTSIHTLPVLFTGHVFLHSYLHFLGLHLSGLMMAILSLSSASILDIKLQITSNHFKGFILCFNLWKWSL